jgi:hypothetical protein
MANDHYRIPGYDYVADRLSVLSHVRRIHPGTIIGSARHRFSKSSRRTRPLDVKVLEVCAGSVKLQIRNSVERQNMIIHTSAPQSVALVAPMFAQKARTK